MKILILGNGYIGKALHRELQGTFDVALVGRSDLDYHDESILSEYLMRTDTDLVIGCFGFTGKPNIDEAETKKQECWNLNVQIPLRVNMLCADIGIGFMQISSGCIFDGYQKEWTEQDMPNFGMFNPSSFYSHCKHAFELASQDLPGTIIRIRMPFGEEASDRSLLSKLLKYDRIINMRNSKTCIEDLAVALKQLIAEGSIFGNERSTYHMVNSEPLTTKEVVAVMKEFGLCNPRWKFVDISNLAIAAPRSNCVITTNNTSNPMLKMPTEMESLRRSLAKMTGRTP
jgi:dTDP-4-dehydrorhamnose reductase